MLISRRIAGQSGRPVQRGCLVHARGMVAESRVQRTEPAVSGGAASEKQFGTAGALRKKRFGKERCGGEWKDGCAYLLEAREHEGGTVGAVRKQRVVVV